MNRGKPQKFKNLAEQILREIQSGELHSGDRLAPERELAKRYQCNHLTVRKALKQLASQGIIHTIPGKGSFPGTSPAARHQPQSDRIGFIFPDDEIFYYRIFAAVERMAASNGNSSSGFKTAFTPSRRNVCVTGSSCIAAVSGTCFRQTAIFNS